MGRPPIPLGRPNERTAQAQRAGLVGTNILREGAVECGWDSGGGGGLPHNGPAGTESGRGARWSTREGERRANLMPAAQPAPPLSMHNGLAPTPLNAPVRSTLHRTSARNFSPPLRAWGGGDVTRARLASFRNSPGRSTCVGSSRPHSRSRKPSRDDHVWRPKGGGVGHLSCFLSNRSCSTVIV